MTDEQETLQDDYPSYVQIIRTTNALKTVGIFWLIIGTIILIFSSFFLTTWIQTFFCLLLAFVCISVGVLSLAFFCYLVDVLLDIHHFLRLIESHLSEKWEFLDSFPPQPFEFEPCQSKRKKTSKRKPPLAP
ncbi:MAG: hypothetical protein C4527_15325 [Candidatus Omnitrophota bacterium]|jgi:hypothetical protein|nr:MAG: hypothetical protein C4527_15325 [Candidatus Omnitrophota bacterium]